MKTILSSLLCLGLSGTAQAALFVDPAHIGQVLIFPYYTVNGGQDSLLSLTNHGADAKALKVRFREGRNGRVVDSFNLYLAPYDSWSAAVFQLEAEGPAVIITQDTSCTVPGLERSTRNPLPSFANGLRYRRFSNADYSLARADAGPGLASRSREGWLEVIEMGTLPPGTPAHIAALPAPAPDNTVRPANCDWFEAAWDNGAFSSAPAALLAPPSGQLSGRLFVVDVSEGTAVSLRATAIGGFSNQVQHTAPAAALPDLSSARTEVGNDSIVSSIAWTDQGPVRSSWDRNRALDAVSAVLMRSEVAGEVNLDPGLGARTEWVLSMPTRPGRTDQALVGPSPQAPFTAVFPGTGVPLPTVLGCENVRMRAYDRDGQDRISVLYKTSPPPPPISFCHGTQVLAFTRTGTATPLLGSALYQEINPLDPRFKTGQVQVDFTTLPQRRLVSREGHAYEGLPVIGHAIELIQNQSAKPGVIGFYAESSPLVGTLRCTQPDPTLGSRPCGTE